MIRKLLFSLGVVFWTVAVCHAAYEGHTPPPPSNPCGQADPPLCNMTEHGPGGDGAPCEIPLWGSSGTPEGGENVPTDEEGEDTNTNDGTNTEDPISVIDGAVLVQELEIVIPCPLIDIVFLRNYNSNLAYSRPLGERWTHSYNWTLVEYSYEEGAETPDWVSLRAESNPWLPPYNGEFHWFERQEDGNFVLADNVPYRLEIYEVDSYKYKLKIPGGINYLFDTNGVLQKIEHVAGQHVNLSYTNTYPNHALVRVEHSNGQYLSFSYTNGLIAEITTPSTNLSVRYTYNENSELVEAVRKTGRGNFTNSYVYSKENSIQVGE